MLGLLFLIVMLTSFCWLDIHRMEPRRIDKRAIINSEIDAKKRMKAKSIHVTEPYNDSHFTTNPLNFDIDGFWESYRHNNN